MARTTMYPSVVMVEASVDPISSSGTAPFSIGSVPGIVYTASAKWSLCLVKLDYGDDMIGSIDVVLPIVIDGGSITARQDVFISMGEGYTVTRVIVSVDEDMSGGTVTAAPYGGAGIEVSSVELRFLAPIH